MAYTGHGHHIPGTKEGKGALIGETKFCGGVEICPRCKSEVEHTISLMVGTPEDYPGKAKDAVRKLVDDNLDMERKQGESLPEYDVYVVWFSKTLRNWKALVSTTLDDQMYYEITYNGENREMYIDSYKKIGNVVIVG